MATREYEFNVGPETATQPTVGTPVKGDIIVHDGTDYQRLGVGADGLALLADSSASEGVAWGTASTGTGEINYIDNPNAEANTTGWATYANTVAAATPEDGDGGSPTVTWTRQSSVILRGNHSFKLTKDAANRQGEGASYDFTIKDQDTSKKLKIQFDFKTDEDAAYSSGDLTVYIYDVTNTTLITPVDTDIIDGQNIFQTSFNSTTSTSYRLIFHVATTNASAWDAYIDNVIVGPGMVSQGAAIGPAESVTVTGSWTNNTTYTAFETRVGEWAHYEIEVACSGAPNSTTLEINLPSGRTIDTSKLASGTDTNWYARLPGSNVIHFENGVTTVIGSVRYNTTTQVAIQHWDDAAAGVAVNNNTAYNDPFNFGANDKVIVGFKVPILEWAGKGIVPMLAEDNLSSGTTATPSWGNITVGNATPNSLTYYRTGDRMKCQGYIKLGSTSSVGGSITVTIPGGLTADYSKTPQYQMIGNSWATDPGNARHDSVLYLSDTTTVAFTASDGTNSEWNATTPFTWGTSDELHFSFEVAITEWAGSQNSLVGYSEASADNLGLVKKPDGEVKVTQGNGHGSTATRIRRFTNTQINTGDSITYADSSTNGGSFTINEDGIYAMSYTDYDASNIAQMGISKNASSLTDAIASISQDEKLAYAESSEDSAGSGHATNLSVTARLSAGDVVRCHDNNLLDSTDPNTSWFHIVQVAKL